MVLVNLENGSYYTLDRVGLDIWDQLVAGADRDGVSKAMAVSDESRRDEIEKAVNTFIDTLAAERLIVAAPDGEPPAGLPAPASRGNGRSFTAPVLQRYTDMQELLLLDPIHEVDEAGWPSVKPETGGPDA
jgi:hypothetical protein